MAKYDAIIVKNDIETEAGQFDLDRADLRDLQKINAKFGVHAIDVKTNGFCGEEYTYFGNGEDCVLMLLPA